MTTEQTALVKAKEVSLAAWEIVKEDATYTIRFGGKSRRQVTALSAVGAKELYTQAAKRGLVPEFKPLAIHDQVIDGFWICDITWRATDKNTGESWNFSTRGAEPYDRESDSLAVASRKAYGKAVRNANIECVPLVIRKAFLAHLQQHTGKTVQEEELSDPPYQHNQVAPIAPGAPLGINKEMAQAIVDKADKLGVEAISMTSFLRAQFGKDRLMELTALETPRVVAWLEEIEKDQVEIPF